MLANCDEYFPVLEQVGAGLAELRFGQHVDEQKAAFGEVSRGCRSEDRRLVSPLNGGRSEGPKDAGNECARSKRRRPQAMKLGWG